MAIIRHPLIFFAAPDFRNLSVIAKILFSVMTLMFTLPLVSTAHQNLPYLRRVSELALWMVPSTLISLMLLMLLNFVIRQTRLGPALVVGVVSAVFSLYDHFFNPDDQVFWSHFWAVFLYTLMLLHYHAVMQKARSPALAEARLTALTARIRPHFLFNSLNAAISLVRTRPIDAEMVLENLAELFRAQLQSSTQISTLGKEVELAQSYLDIEQIRMGEDRLKIEWEIEHMPAHAQTPHLFLQPLLENAVMHGIEPSVDTGVIRTRIVQRQNWIYIRIENPLVASNASREGNGMALENLAERLQLMYDSDATLSAQPKGRVFQVNIRIPYYR